MPALSKELTRKQAASVVGVEFKNLGIIGSPESCLVYWHGRAVGKFSLWIDDVAVFHGKRPTFHVATIEAAEDYFVEFYASHTY